jgi:zinc/manganese transport system permease protein
VTPNGVVLAAGTGFAQMLAHPFMQHAFVAGTAIAAACGLVGYFVVLRSQVFSGDALSHAAFTGALGALALGVDLRLGLFVITALVALGMGLLGPQGRADDVVIGTVFTWVLGLGVLFATLYSTSGNAGQGTATVNVLFGSILGLSSGQAALAAVVGVGASAAVIAVGRPLLFASIDAAVAAARGVPVRVLGAGFLVLVGVAAAEATQAVGALLLVGLIAAPAAAAQLLTDRPWRGMALAAALAVLAVWIGLTASYLDGSVPPSFAIMAVATAQFCFAVAWTRSRSARRDPVASRGAPVDRARRVSGDLSR